MKKRYFALFLISFLLLAGIKFGPHYSKRSQAPARTRVSVPAASPLKVLLVWRSEGKYFAVVQDPRGSLFTVKRGDFIPSIRAKVLRITSKRVIIWYKGRILRINYANKTSTGGR